MSAEPVTDLQDKRDERDERARDAEEWTDTGAARRLVCQRGEILRWEGRERPVAWDGARWIRGPEAAARAQEAAKDVAHMVVAEILKLDDKESLKHAVRGLAEPALRRAQVLASSDPLVRVKPEEFDADPLALNAPNGIIDLRTGALRPHDPAELHTRMAGVEYRPDARSDLLRRFLVDLTGGDKDYAAYLQRAVGYTLTGLTSEEVLLILFGDTASGKTTLEGMSAAALGDYAAAVSIATFLHGARDGSSATPDLARLPGVRLAYGSEVNPGARFDPERVKSLTGGDKILARGLHKDPFEFRPAFTVWLAANHRPAIPASDEAMWRRVRPLPTHAVPPSRRDPQVKVKLTGDPEHLAAFLAWAVEGCIAWQRDGLGTCAAVEAAIADYREESDPLAEWIADRCELAAEHRTSTADLRASYEEWAQRNGERPVSGKAFGAALRARGLETWRTERQRGWAGIGMTA